MDRPGFTLPASVTVPGAGSLVVERVAAASTVLSARASAPLKLLVPRPRGPSVWAYASTFGGGLLEGDAITLDVRIGPGATTLCATQASTKVYKSERGGCSRQTLLVSVGEDALFASLPDPVCPFAGAIYQQRQRIELLPGASLVLVDGLVSGRAARGERYRFTSYRTTTEVVQENRLLVLDALTLEDTPESSIAERMGRFDVYTTAILVGPRVEAAATALIEDTTRAPVRPPDHVRSRLLATASPIPGGAVLRVAGEEPEPVAAFLRVSLAFLVPLLGDDPWARKW
ncbi:urease accessory protein UreD [Polyangium jinanense]|uniref:Urease accessory protein UreD n=1 Tax=Polyangium jinanense TaxID=2829994 RepID=A0A9X4AQ82_9BACT|nr:urease accessory protein UreD [Polyangium jinanense]MDC3952448.1 urease accessory protein UreD [Polyangium jinanense]MDC3980076.1 urease accessory protein UreD [Polyangium jinanense]